MNARSRAIADYYVSPGGHDANEGTRPEAPLRSLTRAVALIAEAYAARGNVAVSELVHLEPGLYSRGSGELFPIIVPALTDVTVTATFPPDLRFPVIRVRVLDESAVLERVDGALIWVDAATRVSQVSFSGMLMTRDGYERRGATRGLRLSAMVALTALDLDTGAQETLRRFAESKDTEATEAAYAQEALSTIRRRARTAPSA